MGLIGDLLFRGEAVFLGVRFFLAGDLVGVFGCFFDGDASGVDFFGVDFFGVDFFEDEATLTLGKDICAFFFGEGDGLVGEAFLLGVLFVVRAVFARLGVGWSSFSLLSPLSFKALFRPVDPFLKYGLVVEMGGVPSGLLCSLAERLRVRGVGDISSLADLVGLFPVPVDRLEALALESIRSSY